MGTGAERWVLVVEDNACDELIAKRAFACAGRSEQAIFARDGEQALKELRERHSPALIVLDMKLPRLSGLEVLFAINEDDRLRLVPVVVLTSSNERTDIAACYELGCKAFVHKPEDFQEYMAAYSSILDFWLKVNMTIDSVV